MSKKNRQFRALNAIHHDDGSRTATGEIMSEDRLPNADTLVAVGAIEELLGDEAEAPAAAPASKPARPKPAAKKAAPKAAAKAEAKPAVAKPDEKPSTAPPPK